MAHLLPGCTGFHQLVVHIPIILLLIAPFFVIAGMGLPAVKGGQFFRLALTLMVVGTAMTFVAAATGKAAMKVLASMPVFPALAVALEKHRALAETTTEVFSVLTLGFAALLYAPRRLGRELDSRINKALLAVYLVFYATGALFLVHTALQGGHVVRKLAANPTAIYQLSGKETPR